MESRHHGRKRIKKKKNLIELGQEKDQRALEEKDLAELLPWNLWWTRLDKLSQFNPIEMFTYYFVPHFTGPSILFLLFTMACVGLYLAILITRRLDDRFAENVWYIFEPARVQGLTTFELPTFTGYALQSSLNASDVSYVWEVCSLEPKEMSPTSTLFRFENPFVASCTQIGSQACPFGGGDKGAFSWQCPLPTSTNRLRLRGLPHQSAKGNWDFVRFRLKVTKGVVSSTRLSLEYGAKIANDIVDDPPLSLQDIAFQQTMFSSFPLDTSQTRQVHFLYEPNDYEVLGRYLVTEERYQTVRYNRHVTELVNVKSDGNDWILFESVYSLDSRFRKIYQREMVFLDIIARVCALIVILWSIGVVIRYYNRWHFFHFGRFQQAELPTYFTDSLFDPTIPFSTPGLKELILMRNDPAKRLHMSQVRQSYSDVSNIRKLLDSVTIGEAPQK